MKAYLIDIGSNSIRSMTAEDGASGLLFSEKSIYTTRLAQGIDQSGALSNESMRRSFDVLTALSSAAKALGLPIYCYATSAVRDASNGAAFAQRIRETLHMPVEVLSGQQEARLALLGAANGTGALLDIGGGSAQIVSDSLSYSAACGCVRAKDRCPVNGTPEQLLRALTPWLDTVFTPPMIPEGAWTGVGGTITTLAAFDLQLTQYDHDAVSGRLLTEAAVTDALERLYRLGEDRRNCPLLSARHDVILPGGTVLLALMRRCRIPFLRVSDADGLEGYALALWQRQAAR